MSPRTLVIILGQLRAAQLTWNNFKENVLDQLGADLAVCVPDNSFFDFTNPFYVSARYRWLVPDATDFAAIFDRIQYLLGSTEDWRVLCDVRGSWLGKIQQSNQPGAAAVLFVLRWFMLNNIQAAGLAGVYDRFIITRSDFYYLCPHPPLEYLDNNNLWFPDGEDYGGLCDRHLVVSVADLFTSCNLIEELLIRPQEMRSLMIKRSNWNIEQVIAMHFSRKNLMSKVKRFPYIMFLVRVPEDPTAWAAGEYIADVNMIVKYPSELKKAARYRSLIRSNEDWRLYFASSYFPDLSPKRIYTTHDTVLYVDESSGLLRHGKLSDAPANAFFIAEKPRGRIVHSLGDQVFNILYFPDHCKSSCLRSQDEICTQRPVTFERVPIKNKNMVGLRAGDIYLSAEPDGRVILKWPICLAWEHFLLIADPKIRAGSGNLHRTISGVSA